VYERDTGIGEAYFCLMHTRGLPHLGWLEAMASILSRMLDLFPTVRWQLNTSQYSTISRQSATAIATSCKVVASGTCKDNAAPVASLHLKIFLKVLGGHIQEERERGGGGG